jgi:hypothetical protein
MSRWWTSSSPVPPVLPAVMRPPSAVASAQAGGDGEEEQGEAQGGSEVLVSGHVRVIQRMANRKWRILWARRPIPST